MALTMEEIARDDGVDLSEVETCDMVAELESRGLYVTDEVSPYFIDEVFSALQQGSKDKALEIVRNYICDFTGRILP